MFDIDLITQSLYILIIQSSESLTDLPKRDLINSSIGLTIPLNKLNPPHTKCGALEGPTPLKTKTPAFAGAFLDESQWDPTYLVVWCEEPRKTAEVEPRKIAA